MREAHLDGGGQRTADLHLLADALEDDDVRIDGHADAQDDTRDARQGQLRTGERQQQHDDHDIDGERDVGHQAAQAIAQQHEQHDKRHANRAGQNRLIKRLDAQGRGDRADLQLGQVQRQRAGQDEGRQVLGLVGGEVAGDLALAAGNHAVDGRCRDGLAVQRDGDGLADVGSRRFGETLRALVVQLKGDARQSVLVLSSLRVLDHRAFQDVFAVLVHEVQLRRRADDAQDLVGIGDVRDLHTDAVGTLAGDGRLGEALTGQTAGEDGHGRAHLRLEFLGAVILRRIDGVHAAAQIQAQGDRFTPRLEIVDHRALANAKQRHISADSDDHQDGHQRNDRAGTRVLRLCILVRHSDFPLFILFDRFACGRYARHTNPSPSANA